MRVLTVAAGVLLAGVVSAQPPGGFGFGGMFGGGGGGNVMALLVNEAVQKDLKMTPEQVEKAVAANKEFRPKMMEMLQGAFGQIGPDTPPEDRQKAMTSIMAEVSKEAMKEAEKVLKPEQVKRVKQIQLQASGVGAFQMPDTAKALKLTADQQKEMKQITDDFGQEAMEMMRDAFGGGMPDPATLAEVRKKTEVMQKKAFEKAAAKLTDDQKKAWKELTGEPFDVTKLTPVPRKKD